MQIGIDPGSKDGDMTAIALRMPDGKTFVDVFSQDAIEYQRQLIHEEQAELSRWIWLRMLDARIKDFQEHCRRSEGQVCRWWMMKHRAALKRDQINFEYELGGVASECRNSLGIQSSLSPLDRVFQRSSARSQSLCASPTSSE